MAFVGEKALQWINQSIDHIIFDTELPSSEFSGSGSGEGSGDMEGSDYGLTLYNPSKSQWGFRKNLSNIICIVAFIVCH